MKDNRNENCFFACSLSIKSEGVQRGQNVHVDVAAEKGKEVLGIIKITNHNMEVSCIERPHISARTHQRLAERRF